MLCLPCLGTGRFPEGRTCRKCEGRGELPDARLANPMCPYCVGRGRDPFRKGQLCSVCDGWGRLPDKPQSGQTANAAPALPDPGLQETARFPPSTGLGGATTGKSIGPGDLFRGLIGDVDVCEPAITELSLDRLRLLHRCDMIRVLTQGVDDRLIPLFRAFTRELPRFLFRRYEGRPLHDRYFLTATEIVFLAPRREESDDESPALFSVPVEVAGEMVQEMRLGFNRLWGAGSRLG